MYLFYAVTSISPSLLLSSLSLWTSPSFLSLRRKKGLLSSTQTLFPFTDNLLQRSVYGTITASLLPSGSLLYPLQSGFQPHLNWEATPADGRCDICITQSNIKFLVFDIHAVSVSLTIDHISFWSPLFFFGNWDITFSWSPAYLWWFLLGVQLLTL